jgi:stage II sporulation protein D
MNRKIFLYVFIILFIFVIMPALIVKSCQAPSSETKEGEDEQMLKILDVQNNKVLEMELEEYLKGVVAAEMPATFELEALKAQAVAASTFTLRRMQGTIQAHPKYDICTDPSCCQAFVSEDERLKIWQDSGISAADSILRWEKIEKAVDETKGKVLVYNDELISALYHSTSGGKTENSEDYFVSAVPYLRSVESLYEEDNYVDIHTTISIQDFLSVIETKYPDFEINENKIANNIKINSYTTGGKVKEITIGNLTFTGREIRELFDLRSSGFEIDVSGKNIVFITNGFGHGVGMSQYGANGYAKQGCTYEEILLHYYQGVEIIDYKDLN